MGWTWFIPTFHMTHPPPGNGSGNGNGNNKATFHLTRKDMDFPLGVGSLIVDMDVSLEWVGMDGPPPPPQTSNRNSPAPGLPSAIQAIAAGATTQPGGIVEAKQAADD
jgi:phosphatidylinositol-3,4,5-trisphosphate 3-phosphatase and dual-specificity protein phosphatase PTEN